LSTLFYIPRKAKPNPAYQTVNLIADKQAVKDVIPPVALVAKYFVAVKVHRNKKGARSTVWRSVSVEQRLSYQLDGSSPINGH
jgi:hypothetical protein